MFLISVSRKLNELGLACCTAKYNQKKIKIETLSNTNSDFSFHRGGSGKRNFGEVRFG